MVLRQWYQIVLQWWLYLPIRGKWSRGEGKIWLELYPFQAENRCTSSQARACAIQPVETPSMRSTTFRLRAA